MNIALRSRRVAMTAVALLTLGLGGSAAVSVSAAAPAAAATSVGTPTVTDDVQGTVTTTDDIVTCLPSTISIGGTTAVAFNAGCLTEYYGDTVAVTWSGTGISTKLTLQAADGNFVLYAGNGKVWASSTAIGETSTGPGCRAPFQGDGNLVVYNCARTAIWASNTDNHASAVLCFQADGNLVIYNSTAGAPLWATRTYS